MTKAENIVIFDLKTLTRGILVSNINGSQPIAMTERLDAMR